MRSSTTPVDSANAPPQRCPDHPIALAYRRAAHLADTLWDGADAGLHNALNVSFLEDIDFEGSRGPHAWSLLSPRLQRARRAMAVYNQWLHSGAQGERPAEADV